MIQTAVVFILAVSAAAFAQTGYTISTAAGNGSSVTSGDGGPATSAGFAPNGIAVDAAGNLFISDALGYRVREVSAATGIINTVAGNGRINLPFPGPPASTDGQPATSVALNGSPTALVVDASGNFCFAEYFGDIRKVTIATGIISTVASVSGQLAIDASGNIYVSGANIIQRIDAVNHAVTTIAGTGTSGFSGDGGPAVSAAFTTVAGLAADAAGNLFFADFGNNRIRRIDAVTGIITTIAGNGTAGFSGDGGPATSAALNSPNGVAVDASGNIYIPDTLNYRIRKVDTATGNIHTIAGTGTSVFSGDGGPSLSAGLDYPNSIVVDSLGRVFFGDNYRYRVLTPQYPVAVTSNPAGLSVTVDGAAVTTPQTFIWTEGSTHALATADQTTAAGLVYRFSSWSQGGAASQNVVAAANATFTAIFTLQPPVIACPGSGPAPGVPYAMTCTASGGIAPYAWSISSGSLPGGLSLDSATGVISGTPTATGTSNFTLQAADANSQTGRLSLTLTVAIPQSIAFNPLPGVALGVAPFTVSATASSGLTVTFASATTSVCTVSGNTVTVLAAGTCSIVASQAGNSTYATATPVVQSFTASTPTWIIKTIAGNGSAAFNGDGKPALNSQFSIYGIAVDASGKIYIADYKNCRIRVLAASVISTVAGNGTCTYSGDGGPATLGGLVYPTGVAVDPAGNIYIADSGNDRIRQVSAATGVITTVAGTGVGGFTGDGGAAISAQLQIPDGVWVDSSGNLYVADSGNNSIRKVAAGTGIITTVANQSGGGFGGDGGPATSAKLAIPDAVALDGAGNIFIADTGNNRIREVTAATGNISTVAGNGQRAFSGDGGPATAAGLSYPLGVTLDSAGNVYFTDTFNNRIRRVDAVTSVITTFAGNGVTPGTFSGDGGPAVNASIGNAYGVAFDSAGNLYIADTTNNRIREVYPAWPISVATSTTGLNVTVDSTSVAAPLNAYWTPGSSHTIAASDQTTAAGLRYKFSSWSQGGGASQTVVASSPATYTANFTLQPPVISCPVGANTGTGTNYSLTCAASGGVGPYTWSISTGALPGGLTLNASTGAITGTPTATGAYSFTVQAVDSNTPAQTGSLAVSLTILQGQTITFNALSNVIIGSAPFTISATASSGLTVSFSSTTTSVCTLSGSTVTIVATGTCSIVATQAGNSTYAPASPVTQGFSVNPKSYIITTVAGGGFNISTGDGGPATSAGISLPTALTLDAAGNLYIGDYNYRIRRVSSATGIIITVAGNDAYGYSGDGGQATAANLETILGLASDAAGNLYVSTGNRIRKITASTGVITTFAGNGSSGFSGDGGPATAATLNSPAGLAFDAAGDLFFADAYNHRIRRVDAVTGNISTVAGNGTSGFSGDGGPAASATLASPFSVFVDNAGNLLIADSGNNRIREVAAATGIITTVAGGCAGSTPATSMCLSFPRAAVADASGNLFIMDTSAQFIREASLATGAINTIAGTGAVGFGGDGGPATSAGVALGYGGLAIESSGSVYFVDSYSYGIRKLTPQPAVLITTNPRGLNLTIDGAVVAGPQDYSWAAGSTHTLAAADQTTSAGTKYLFSSWSQGGTASQTITASTGATYTANFTVAPVSVSCAAGSPAATIGIIYTFTCTATGGIPSYSWSIISGALPSGLALNSNGSITGTPAATGASTFTIQATDSSAPPLYATAKVTVTVSSTQTLAFAALANQTLYGPPFTVSATASSGLPVTFSTTTTSVCTVAGNTVTIVGQGTCTVTATQAGNATYGATSVSQSFTVTAPGYTVSTIAGGGTADGSLATTIPLYDPRGVAVDAAGNIYFAEQSANRVRKVSAATGLISTIAGNGAADSGGDGGPATSAGLNEPVGIALDSQGNVYIAEELGARIRRVAASTGIISTVAGNGSYAYSGDGGPATSAAVTPWGVAVDTSGNIYVADQNNNRIRRVSASTGIITTVAGNGTQGYTGDGGPATSARLNHPAAIAVDVAGNLYIADGGNYAIRKVTASTGYISTIVGTGVSGVAISGDIAAGAPLGSAQGVAVNQLGDVYVADPNGRVVWRIISPIGILEATAGSGAYGYQVEGAPGPLILPLAVATDPAGNVYICDGIGKRILKEAAITVVIATTVAGAITPTSLGDGGQAASALLVGPAGVAVDQAANVYIADRDANRIRKVSAATGIITTAAGTGAGGFSGDGGLATNNTIYYPVGVATDSAGNLYIADTANQRIRRVDASTGVMTTIAGTGVAGYNGDGGPASSARLYNPSGVVVDSAGNVYIADSTNSRIRKVAASTGIITTVAGNGTAGYNGDGISATAAELYNPSGVAVDPAGNLYIADVVNGRIRKVSAATGLISTYAGNGASGHRGDGGPATSATINAFQVTSDSAGNVYFPESGTIRKITASTGVINTIAGSPNLVGFGGDGGPALSALFSNINGVALDASGNIYVADTSNFRIRKLGLATAPTVNIDAPSANASLSGTTAISGWAIPAAGSAAPIASVEVLVDGVEVGTASYGGARPDVCVVYPGRSGCPNVGWSYNLNVASFASGSHTLKIAATDAVSITGFSQVTFRVSQASQSITFAAPGAVTLPASPFTLNATASSGLPVTFTSNTPSVCTVSGSTMTILVSGGCSITASQSGNANCAAAAPVTQRFTVLFADIQPTDFDATAAGLLAQYGITAGCGNNDFCPNANVTRAQMAIFMVRAIEGGDNFTFSAAPYFSDVQTTDFGFKWIQKMKELGITAGCTATAYCPNDNVTRAQMAIFIVRARLGVNLAGSPPTFSYSTTPSFTDVAAGDFGFAWIQRMKRDGITAGCTATTYCPNDPVTRGQMAIFIMRAAFNLLLPVNTPVLTQISPSILPVGTSGTYTITGTNTNFVQGTTTISPLPGITIGTVTVNSPTSLTVQLTAAANAIAQPYSVLAVTGSEEAVLPNSLVIQ